APCEEKRSTTPSTIDPIGWSTTNAAYTCWSLIGSPCAVERRRRARGSVAAAGAGAGASDAFAAGFAAGFAADFAGFGVLRGVAFAACFLGEVRASRTDRRLAGPRTGARSTNDQPTVGTGFP